MNNGSRVCVLKHRPKELQWRTAAGTLLCRRSQAVGAQVRGPYPIENLMDLLLLDTAEITMSRMRVAAPTIVPFSGSRTTGSDPGGGFMLDSCVLGCR